MGQDCCAGPTQEPAYMNSLIKTPGRRPIKKKNTIKKKPTQLDISNHDIIVSSRSNISVNEMSFLADTNLEKFLRRNRFLELLPNSKGGMIENYRCNSLGKKK